MQKGASVLPECVTFYSAVSISSSTDPSKPADPLTYGLYLQRHLHMSSLASTLVEDGFEHEMHVFVWLGPPFMECNNIDVSAFLIDGHLPRMGETAEVVFIHLIHQHVVNGVWMYRDDTLRSLRMRAAALAQTSLLVSLAMAGTSTWSSLGQKKDSSTLKVRTIILIKLNSVAHLHFFFFSIEVSFNFVIF